MTFNRTFPLQVFRIFGSPAGSIPLQSETLQPPPSAYGPFCFAGSEVDTNQFGGTTTDANLYGGTFTDTNLYGGTFADTNLYGGTENDFNPYSGNGQLGPNLLTNPGFETGTFTDWSLVQGTEVISNTEVYAGNWACQITSGSNSIKGEIAQTVTTVPGNIYVASIWCWSPATATYYIEVVNQTYGSATCTANTWTLIQFTYVATSTSSEFVFFHYNADVVMYVDNANLSLICGYGGTFTDTNAGLGGTETDGNNYGGTAYAGCFVDMQAVNITIGEFNDETIDLTITNNSSAFNLTGYGLQVLLKTAAGVADTDPSTVILCTSGGSNYTATTAITVTNAAEGLATLVIPHSELGSTAFTFWRCDVTVVASDDQATAMYGTVTVKPL
jgi:hypothetical protein